jgi:Protein of unknown function (DUF2459)
MIYIPLFVLSLPLILLYLLLALLSPLLRFGGVQRGGDRTIYVVGDLIHSDYVFPSWVFPEFQTDREYVKVGWGDRRIFLETRTWGELRVEDFLRAFFGLNPTVLRVEFMDVVPVGVRAYPVNLEQLEVLREHVKRSYGGNPIGRRHGDYQGGVFYESGLGYNCVTNCNNWVNLGLRRAGLTNRVWAPLSF